MTTHAWLWIFFLMLVGVALAVDLGLKSHRQRTKAVSFAEALKWTLFWTALALFFAGVIYVAEGHHRALEFLTGYLIEESLSIDNMVVFVAIFHFFKISGIQQPRILKWGILGAVVMRFIFIFTGVSLLARFHWMMYVFGGFLMITAFKLAMGDEKEMNPGENKALKLFQRFVPAMTPFIATLLVIEASDLVFALDSIPAVLAISKDPFIVYSSNIFAILGLRSLYFVVSGFLGFFQYLRYGLAVVLAFIGAKMLLSDIYNVPVGVSLAVVAGILMLSILLSLWCKENKS